MCGRGCPLLALWWSAYALKVAPPWDGTARGLPRVQSQRAFDVHIRGAQHPGDPNVSALGRTHECNMHGEVLKARRGGSLLAQPPGTPRVCSRLLQLSIQDIATLLKASPISRPS